MLHSPISEAKKSMASNNAPRAGGWMSDKSGPPFDMNAQSLYGNQAVLRQLSELAHGPAGPSVSPLPANATAAPAVVPAPLGPIDQARSDITAALNYTVDRLNDAIALRDRIGIVPHDVDNAMCRFFPGFGDKFLDDVLARVQPMSGWIAAAPVLSVPRPAPAGFRDAALLNLITWPAQAMVRRVLTKMAPGPDYVAVFPDWYKDSSLRATRLLHELFHFFYVGMFHTKPLNDAFAWQGFVSDVGGLYTGPDLASVYPPCKR